MANHDVSNAEFNSELRRYETTDRGSASVFNENEKVLINNDIALKKLIENSNSSSNSQLGDISKDVNDVNDKLDKVINDTGTNADIASEISETLWGRIKFIMNNWTSARANNLDNLDTKISTRAAQSTLDSINTKIDLLSASITNSSGGGIKCVYRGKHTCRSVKEHIQLETEINVLKSFLIIEYSTVSDVSYRTVAGEIADSQTIYIHVDKTLDASVTVYWQVIEFN